MFKLFILGMFIILFCLLIFRFSVFKRSMGVLVGFGCIVMLGGICFGSMLISGVNLGFCRNFILVVSFCVRFTVLYFCVVSLVSWGKLFGGGFMEVEVEVLVGKVVVFGFSLVEMIGVVVEVMGVENMFLLEGWILMVFFWFICGLFFFVELGVLFNYKKEKG